jgi:hypothetical protein
MMCLNVPENNYPIFVVKLVSQKTGRRRNHRINISRPCKFNSSIFNVSNSELFQPALGSQKALWREFKIISTILITVLYCIVL